LIKKLIDYCKKKKIERIITNIDKNSKELKLFRKMKFKINTNKIFGVYNLK